MVKVSGARMRVYLASHVEAVLEDRLHKGLDWIGFDKLIPTGARIAIKPNFTYPRYKQGATTSPALLKALVKILSRRTSNISIVESDGGLDAWTADHAFEGHGITKLAKSFGVRPVNLSRSDLVEMRLPVPGKNITLSLPRLLLDQTDIFITVPVLKTHTQTGVSLGIKNLWGCIPTTKRLLYHSMLPEILVGLVKLFRPVLSIIDATWAMDGLGPMYGDVIKTDCLLISNNLGAGEITGCRAMGIDFSNIRHLRLAQTHGILPDENLITYNRPPDSVITHCFRPKRDLRQTLVHYGPFRSRVLSRLIYLSPLSAVKDRILSFAGPERLK